MIHVSICSSETPDIRICCYVSEIYGDMISLIFINPLYEFYVCLRNKIEIICKEPAVHYIIL